MSGLRRTRHAYLFVTTLMNVLYGQRMQALVIMFGAKDTLSRALVIALAVHLTSYLFTSAIGAGGLWRLGGTFLQLGDWRWAAGWKVDRQVAPKGAGG